MSGSRSSLENHQFPLFYACYLLKSVRTPKSTATYIGSTPNPPRRIRQHNGEISQGAWKTRNGRPWVMQMIVHGFPSKLAALQFEWAWQHPHISRHLRTPDGKQVYAMWRRSTTMRANISVVRRMLATHPYTSWPLQVTLFTPTAVKMWKDVCKEADKDLPLPAGFRETVALEGVDGRAGASCEDWRRPLDVTDAKFTGTHLEKHSLLLSRGSNHDCTVCKSPVNVASASALTVALCPTHGCNAVSHITCLSHRFLSSATHEHLSSSSSAPALIPRGGVCMSCDEYVLWGDIIRASYRRHAGRVASDADLDAEVEVDARMEDNADSAVEGSGEDVAGSDLVVARPKIVKRGKKRTVPQLRRRKNPATAEASSESDRETFDLDNVSGSESESGMDVVVSPSKEVRLSGTKRARDRPKGSVSNASTINAKSISIQPVKRKGRPPKTQKIDVHPVVAVNTLASPKTPQSNRARKSGATSRTDRKAVSKRNVPLTGVPVADQEFTPEPENDSQGNAYMDLYISDTDNDPKLPHSRNTSQRRTSKVKSKAPASFDTEMRSLSMVITTPQTPTTRMKAIRPQEFTLSELKSVDSSDSESGFSPPSASKLLRAMSTLSMSSPSRPMSPSARSNTPRRGRVLSTRSVITVSSNDEEDDVIILSD